MAVPPTPDAAEVDLDRPVRVTPDLAGALAGAVSRRIHGVTAQAVIDELSHPAGFRDDAGWYAAEELGYALDSGSAVPGPGGTVDVAR
jgi:hypothetical protein